MHLTVEVGQGTYNYVYECITAIVYANYKIAGMPLTHHSIHLRQC